jgi:HNH endonuclease
MKTGKAISYTEAELAWIAANCALPRREAHAAFCEKFGRSDVSLQNYVGLCKRNGWLTGRTGHYAPGSMPANKGKKMPYNAKTAQTQFKKGHSPHNTKFAGHERLHEDGYVYTSINETNPHTGYERRYVLKHKHLWEQKHGPVPDGMVLKCLDGNKENTDPSNWELIPRGSLPFLNGFRGPHYASADDELKPVILTLAKLRAAKRRKVDKAAGREDV